MIKTKIKGHPELILLCYESWHDGEKSCRRCSKFCEICGALNNQIISLNEFDPETGKKGVCYACSNPDCYRSAGYNERREAKKGFWERLFNSPGGSMTDVG